MRSLATPLLRDAAAVPVVVLATNAFGDALVERFAARRATR